MARVHLGDDDEKLVTVDRGATRTKTVKVTDLQPNPENPRPSELEVDEMVESLRLQGQLQNINMMSRAAFVAAKPYLADALNNRPYVVINGRRRLEAASRAGLAELRHELHDEWTAEQIDRAVVLENEDRLDVNPLHLGRFLARMLTGYGSQRKLAHALGKGQAWVQQRIGLTTLHDALQAAIDDGRIQFALARACPRLAPDLQPRLAAGELPADVAHAWLVDLKLKPDEQLTRFAAGPPFDIDPTPPPRAEPADELAGEESAAGERNGATGKPPPTGRQRPIVIRIAERSPAALATALRKEFSDDEIEKIVEALIG